MKLLKRRAAILRYITGLALISLCPPVIASTAGVPCENLARFSMPNTTIDFARTIAAGAFTPPLGNSDPRSDDVLTSLPEPTEACRRRIPHCKPPVNPWRTGSYEFFSFD